MSYTLDISMGTFWSQGARIREVSKGRSRKGGGGEGGGGGAKGEIAFENESVKFTAELHYYWHMSNFTSTWHVSYLVAHEQL